MRKLLLLGTILLLGCTGGKRYVQISGYAQGGTYTVKLNMEGVGVPVEQVRDSIEAILLQIDTTLSGYNRNSLLSRFNAGESIPATPLFLAMYRLSYNYWERSGGKVDCAAAALYDAWGFGFKNSSFPSEEQLAVLLEQGGMDRLPSSLPVTPDGLVDPAPLGYPRLNYNAIAQGYSCDLVAAYLYRIGVKDMLVDIGEIWCDGLRKALECRRGPPRGPGAGSGPQGAGRYLGFPGPGGRGGHFRQLPQVLYPGRPQVCAYHRPG